MLHQANRTSSGKLKGSVWLNQIADINEEALPYDTHFLLRDSDVVFGSRMNEDYAETNDKTNPKGLPSAPPFAYGIGTFGTTGTAFTIPGELDPQGYDLLQVVFAPGDKRAIVHGLCVDSALGAEVPIFFIFPVPEPGTVVLLVAGGVCLVVLRFRKRFKRG